MRKRRRFLPEYSLPLTKSRARRGVDMYIFEQILTGKGHEYMIAVGFVFVFIVFYRFLNSKRKS
jgi:hypothetical protein